MRIKTEWNGSYKLSGRIPYIHNKLSHYSQTIMYIGPICQTKLIPIMEYFCSLWGVGKMNKNATLQYIK